MCLDKVLVRSVETRTMFANTFCYVEVTTSRKTLRLFFCTSGDRCYEGNRFSEISKFEIRRGPYYRALEYTFYFALQGLETKEL